MESIKSSVMKSFFHGKIPVDSFHNFPFFTTNRESDFKIMFDAVNDFLKASVNSEKFDDEKKLPQEFLNGLKEMGLFGLIIPEAFGGSELTQTFYTRILELINFYDTSTSLTVGAHSSIGLKGLYLYGNEEQKKKYMPKLASGEMIASFALTEPTAGSDAAGIKSRLVKDGDYYILNGSKLWITNGSMADFFTVFAKENINGEEKITAIIVTRDMGGVSHGPEEQKLGIKASSTVEVYFKDVRVPIENVLSKPGDGFKVAMGILNQGRLGLAGGAIGAMKAVLDQSIVYAKNRKAFGNSIANFSLIKEMITQMTMSVYCAEAMTFFTTALCDSGDYDYSIEAAICKVYSTQVAWDVLNMAMQIHGGNGYMKDYGIERRLRDGRIAIIFEGTNEILKLFIALSGLKDLGNEFKQVGKDIQSLQNIKNFDGLNNTLSKIGHISEFAVGQIKSSLLAEDVEGFHPIFEKETERLSNSVKILTSSSSRLIRTYGSKLPDEQLQLNRLASIAIDTFLIAAVLSRANSTLEQFGGVEKNANEINLAKLSIRQAKIRINQAHYDIKDNKDSDLLNLAKNILNSDKYLYPIDNVKKTK